MLFSPGFAPTAASRSFRLNAHHVLSIQTPCSPFCRAKSTFSTGFPKANRWRRHDLLINYSQARSLAQLHQPRLRGTRAPLNSISTPPFCLILSPLSSQTSTMATLSEGQSAAIDSRRSPIKRITDHLETPSLDDRSYRIIVLPNKLEVLLVHDADTDKASAAMDVNVGNFSDPEDMPGMSHAVEHLLFMGTKKASNPCTGMSVFT